MPTRAPCFEPPPPGGTDDVFERDTKVEPRDTPLAFGLGSAGGLNDPGANGLVARTAYNETAARTLTPEPGKGMGVADGDGVSGNPTLAIDPSNLPSTAAAPADSVLMEDAASGTPKKTTVPDLASAMAVIDSITVVGGLVGGGVGPGAIAIGTDDTLTALAGLDSAAGLVAQTGADAFAKRSLTPVPGEGVGIANGDGAAAAPTFKIDRANTASATVASADEMLIYDADDAKLKRAAASGLLAAIGAQPLDADLTAIAALGNLGGTLGLSKVGTGATTADGAMAALTGGTSQVLTINSTGANENANGVNYRIMVWGTPT